MESDKIFERMARLLERAPKGKTAKVAEPVEMQDLLWVYFRDPYRPRLSGNAFLVWACLLEKADLDSRIATVSFREIKRRTGIRSNRSLYLVLAELDRFGYLVSATFPTGPGQPRNYKIPDHIRPNRFAHYDALRLGQQADRPRKWPRQKARMLDQAESPIEKPHRPSGPPPWEHLEKAATPSPKPETGNPAPSTPLMDLPPVALPELPALNLEEKVAQATKEVDMILNLLNQNKKA